MKTENKKRATIKHIAERAKVSHPTVSRVLNNNLENFPLKPETIERVRKAAKELNYRPNRSARSLRNQRSHYIGLSMPHSPQKQVTLNPTKNFEMREKLGDFRVPLADMIINMARVGFRRGYETVLMQRQEEQEGRISRKDLFPDTVDGLVYIMPSLQHQEYAEIAQENYHFVLAGYCPSNVDVHSCDVDNEKAIFILTNHLIEKGCRRMLYIYNQARDWVMSERRFTAFQRALFHEGLPFLPEDVHQGVIPQDELIDWIAMRLRDDPSIDGLLYANAEAMNCVTEGVERSGRRVPENLLIAGTCDGLDPNVDLQGITCMHWPLGIIVQQAAELLIDAIEGKVTNTQHWEVEPVLIPRASTNREATVLKC